MESPTARRLFYWYAKLKALEASFDGDPMDMLWLIQELKSSEHAVSHISIPLIFSDQVYNLRSHIDIVRRNRTRQQYIGPGCLQIG